MTKHLLRLALEDVADGVTREEKEHEYYGRLVNLEQLSKASGIEYQEQWTLKFPKTEYNGGSGDMRVRRTLKEGQLTFVQTTKVKQADHRLENSLVSSEAGFNQFKILATNGMRKHRYSFPVGEAFVFEVDCFLKPGTTDEDKDYFEWVKIDLEVDDFSVAAPEIPIHIEDLIADTGESLPQELRDKVTKLYDDYFLSPNEFKGT